MPALAQTVTPCPAELKPLATCYAGADQNGATYWIAIPAKWNRMLVMHAHGGPRLAAIAPDNALEDLQRFAVTVKQGYAWAGSSYRRPGYGVRVAAEDTDNLRKLFIERFGKPALTILHGQSWGGNVAAKGLELYGVNPDGSHNYDGVVFTNGMIAGGTLNYLHRADLRAVYQYYCKNHPRPDEAQYPLWQGLPAGARMTGKELEARVNECTGISLPAAQRSAAQAHNLANILAVVPVPERTLVSNLNWATFMFRDLVQRVLGGRNPFSNQNVAYRGSDDDAALNRGVARFSADPQALAQLAEDSNVSGRLPLPVISLHAIDDPTALVEYETHYRDLAAGAGSAGNLLQTFSNENEHSKLADAEYAALFDALTKWIRTGVKPAARDMPALCAQQPFGGGCHFVPNYVPAPLFSRIAPRN
ncbi:MAG: hypothetical protein V4724_22015 [Pseudomonadota bacterium]